MGQKQSNLSASKTLKDQKQTAKTKRSAKASKTTELKKCSEEQEKRVIVKEGSKTENSNDCHPNISNSLS